MFRFLIIRPDRIGDAIVTQLVLEALAIHVPCEIDVFASDYSYEFYLDNPYIKNIFHCNVENKRQVIQYYKSECKNQKYDAIFVLQSRRRLQQLALLSKCKHRIGFDLVFDKRVSTKIFQWVMSKFRQFSYVQYSLNQHEAFNLKLAIDEGLAGLGLPKLISLPKQCKLYNTVISETKKVANSVAINISGKSSENRVILPSMLMAILLLLMNNTRTITIVATDTDRDKAYDIVKYISRINPDFVVPEIIIDSNIFVIANKINAFEYFISVDGGLLHIAAALGLKCVGLYNNNMKDRWYPWTRTQVTLNAENLYNLSPLAIIDALETLGLK